MSELGELWAAQAELARDPADLAAWHREAARKAAVSAAVRARREASGSKVPAYPLFSAVDAKAFAELAELSKSRRLHASEDVIAQGQPGHSIFIIARGVVRIHRDGRALA